MSRTTFELIRPDELTQWAARENENDLMFALGSAASVLEDSPVSLVLPYFAAMRVYEKHVADCRICLDTPVWDIGCEQGQVLAHEAADMMAEQDEQAAQN